MVYINNMGTKKLGLVFLFLTFSTSTVTITLENVRIKIRKKWNILEEINIFESFRNGSYFIYRCIFFVITGR